MATQKKALNVDLNSMFEGAASQFRGLNPNEPGQWPLLPKAATWLVLGVLVIVVGWFLLLSSAQEELDGVRAKEPTLKQDYRSKLAQAVNLGELRKQKLQVEEYGCGLNFFGALKGWMLGLTSRFCCSIHCCSSSCSPEHPAVSTTMVAAQKAQARRQTGPLISSPLLWPCRHSCESAPARPSRGSDRFGRSRPSTTHPTGLWSRRCSCCAA